MDKKGQYGINLDSFNPFKAYSWFIVKAALHFRILILKKYGGIYLDNDILVINNFDR